jgi:hypothetical protein
MDAKKKRFQEELKRIRQLSAINKVLKKGDVENAFLNNADKETEISKDTAVERMLEEMQTDKSERKDLEVLDSLVKEETAPSRSARPHAPKRGKMPARRPMKRATQKPKKSQKKKR